MVRIHQGPPFKYAGVAKLVDALDLGSSAAMCESSSLSGPRYVDRMQILSIYFLEFEKKAGQGLRPISWPLILSSSRRFLEVLFLFFVNTFSRKMLNSKF